MSSEKVDRTHDNADKSVVFKGLGCFSKGADVKPMTYNPPKLSENFVEIEISHCGICGSDIHTIDSGWGPTNYPVIVGHEIIGTVKAVGSAVKHVKVGQRVGVGAQCGACCGANKDCYECSVKKENHCRDNLLWTYGGSYKDGQVSQGGYASHIRCQGDFVFSIPEAISSAEAAPLMCAGVTTFAPLARNLTRKDMKVAIIGIGGLGHLGIMWASKMLDGAIEVTAISHNSKKKDDALKMGAKYFIDTSDKDQLKSAFRKFDYILSTANGTDMDLANWLSMVKLDGTFCTVGIPEEPLKIPAFALLGAQVNATASGIGSIEDIKQMLEFAAKHNVRPIIERLPMEKANEGIKKMRDGTVRFRVVLENPTAKQ